MRGRGRHVKFIVVSYCLLYCANTPSLPPTSSVKMPYNKNLLILIFGGIKEKRSWEIVMRTNTGADIRHVLFYQPRKARL